MSQSLDEFAVETAQELVDFVAKYRARHEATPEHYPLVLPKENVGLWLEFFVSYMTNGEV